MRWNPVASISSDLVVMCYSSAIDLKAAVTGIAEGLQTLRDRGVRAIPAATLIGSGMKHTYDSWFDKTLWQRYAYRIKEVAGLRAPGDARLALDLEGYFDQEPRYPVRGRDEYRYLDAAQPFIEALKSEGVEPLLAPGGIEYTSVAGLVVALPNATLLDETTYGLPEGQGTWDYHDLRRSAITAIGRRYLPGFYASALRKAAFQTELRIRGIRDYWVFMRTPEDDPEEFFLPRWFAPTSAPASAPGKGPD